MSICNEITKIINEKTFSQSDKIMIEEYESTDKLFESLIQKGLISKRGYQLLPVENRICNNTHVNHKIES